MVYKLKFDVVIKKEVVLEVDAENVSIAEQIGLEKILDVKKEFDDSFKLEVHYKGISSDIK